MGPGLPPVVGWVESPKDRRTRGPEHLSRRPSDVPRKHHSFVPRGNPPPMSDWVNEGTGYRDVGRRDLPRGQRGLGGRRRAGAWMGRPTRAVSGSTRSGPTTTRLPGASGSAVGTTYTGRKGCGLVGWCRTGDPVVLPYSGNPSGVWVERTSRVTGIQ